MNSIVLCTGFKRARPVGLFVHIHFPRSASGMPRTQTTNVVGPTHSVCVQTRSVNHMGRNNSNRGGGNSNRGGGGKGKAMKYEIRADIKVNGTVQRKDIIGAIMGQT
ncbi:MAG TPA: hypothetical protein D7H92_05105, partial [Candidatus Poseidoniales archaeon]